MKHIVILMTALIFTFGNILAQEIKVEEDTKKINGNKQPVLIVEIPKVEQKTVEKEWKNLMKRDYDAESFKSRKEMFADNVLIEPVSDNTIDVYARAEEKKDYIELYVGVDLGGAFMTSEHSKEQEAMKSVIKQFAVRIASEAYQEIVDEQAEIMEDVKDEIEDINDQKEHLNKEIEKYQEKIKENKSEIEDITKNLDEKAEALKEAEKKLEDLKKEASKIK